MIRLALRLCGVLMLAAIAVSCAQPKPQHTATMPSFHYREVMIPMRDGIRLQTVILTPIDQKGPLPIILSRTPYGVPDRAPAVAPIVIWALAHDGYIFVFQSVRGRFKSEGTFGVSTLIDMSNPRAVNDVTDAFDTINWLVKNIPGNNGKVGIRGVSYVGLTSALTLLDPPPALKAVSEQAASADQWMNDDFHRYGALRESYAFEYAVMEQSTKAKNSHFNFDTYDTYQWYLNAGPLSNVNDKYLHGSLSFWNNVVHHPDHDGYWKADAWAGALHGTRVPVLNVAGYWDQEDPWGPWQIFRRGEEHDPDHVDYMVAGPWSHGAWERQPKADRIGQIPFGGHETAPEFRDGIEVPFFRYFLHGIGTKPEWRVKSFETGSNTWQTYSSWPPVDAKPTSLYLHADGTLSFDRPAANFGTNSYREFVSDPANPVPYRRRPISPTYPGGDWETWEVADQRFVDHRPDVLTYVSAPLTQSIRVAGEIVAELYASTSGTDSDFVIKLIDVYPENIEKPRSGDKGPLPGEYANSLNGYELPIAMEIRRGRYLESFEHPTPLVSNRPIKWDIPLRDHDHVFLKGHRIMIQVQSSWFPVIDRNPQKFVPNIYEAKEDDFVKATQRIYDTPKMASEVILPVVPAGN